MFFVSRGFHGLRRGCRSQVSPRRADEMWEENILDSKHSVSSCSPCNLCSPREKYKYLRGNKKIVRYLWYTWYVETFLPCLTPRESHEIHHRIIVLHKNDSQEVNFCIIMPWNETRSGLFSVLLHTHAYLCKKWSFFGQKKSRLCENFATDSWKKSRVCFNKVLVCEN